MKSLARSRHARAGLTVLALALAGCAADSAENQVAGAPTESSAERCPGAIPSHTIVVKDADGRVHRLVHCPDHGWKHFEDQQLGAKAPNLSFPQVQLSPVMSAHALTEVAFENEAAANADPLAVFVDGPTGYTFAWVDGGWQFVGRISDQ